MRKLALTLLVAFSAVTAFAESKADIAFEKKAQFLKLMTVQEIRILQYSLNCLNEAKDDTALKRCMMERQAMVQRLKQPIKRNNNGQR